MNTADTRTRIIEAAVEEFLEKGYDAATIRGICARAGANVASVNYYFGSKEALYASVLETGMAQDHARYPVSDGILPTMTPEEKLKRFIANLMRLNFPEDPASARRNQLYWMEICRPSPVFRPLVERFMFPIRDLLEDILKELLGQDVPKNTLLLSMGAVVGQCMFHAQDRLMIQQLYPEKTYTKHDVDELAEHAWQFSRAGLARIRETVEENR